MNTVVLDTNVLAAGFVGFLNPASAPGRLLAAWRAERFTLVLSEHILDELARTFAKPYFRRRLSSAQVAGVVRLLRRWARIVPITAEVQGVATHPSDDLVLATAVSGGAEYLVTGDRALRELGRYGDVRIVGVDAALALVKPR